MAVSPHDRLRIDGIARDRAARAGALLVARGSFDVGDDRTVDLHEQSPFDVELPDGRRVSVEPDADTALWVPLAMRLSTVGELRARCREASEPLGGWPDAHGVSYQWSLVRDGDRVALLASPRGTRFVADTGGPREAPVTGPDLRSLHVDAIAAGAESARLLHQITTGEDPRVSALGMALAIGGAALIALGVLTTSLIVTGVGLGLGAAGACTWWLGLRAPRSATRLEVLALVTCFAPCVTWFPFTWFALPILPIALQLWSARDARTLREIRRAIQLDQVTVLRDGELSSLESRADTLVVGQVPVTGGLPRRGVALVAGAGRAVLVVPPGRDIAIERWLGRRAFTLCSLWAVAALGIALLVR